MTATIDPSHMLDHDMFMKNIDSTRLQHSEEDIAEIIDIAHEVISEMQNLPDDKKADFSCHETMRSKLEQLFEAHPRAFGYEKQFCWNTKEERDTFIAALQREFKLTSTSSKAKEKEPIPLEQLFHAKPVSSSRNQPRDASEAENKDHADMSETIYGLERSQEHTVKNPAPHTPLEEKKKWKNINLGLAIINMQVQAFDLTEERIKKLIKQLAHLNEINKDLSDFINTLTACKESGKANFNDNPEIQALIDRLFDINPKIFGNQKAYAWDTERQIDVLLSALDAELKTKAAEINQVTMYINVRYDERVQYSEISRKELDMWIRHCESIISKYHKS